MVSVQYTEGSDSPPVPLSQRRQLIVNVADGLARNRPQGTYGYLPVSALGYEKGFRRVSYRQFANMVNGLAWWLTATLGRSSNFEAITYVGPNDFVHNAMVLASVKCGYKLLLASPRNQPDAYKSLLEQVDCKALLSADPKSSLTAMICEVFPMATFQVPSMEVLLTEHFAHYPYTKTFEEAKSDPLLVLHTSGTTSLPKPLTFTNEFTGAYAHALELPVEPGMETKEMYFSGNRMFTTMPPFHAAYLFTTFWMGLLKETTVILPPSQVTPSLDVFIEGIQRIEVSTAFIQPSFISQLASNQEYLNIAAQNVETILASAGNIFDSAVDAVSSRVRLITVFGATEVGGLPDVIPLSTKLAPRDAGAYIHPHPGTGMEFRLYARTEAEQIYEAWIVKNADPGAVQPIFTLFPDATERSTRDLFTPHPIKPNHWRWHSRVDDTVALSTGANVSPASMETGLSQHPAVQGVLMLGNSRVRPLLLVELKDHASYEQEDVKSDIWSTIERLNDNYHQDHKIVKSHLIIAKENKSMLRSLKGSIQRRFTEDLYNPEIDRIYSDVSDGVLNGTNGY